MVCTHFDLDKRMLRSFTANAGLHNFWATDHVKIYENTLNIWQKCGKTFAYPMKILKNFLTPPWYPVSKMTGPLY